MSDALCRPLRDLDPTNEPETTKQLGREAADKIESLMAERDARDDLLRRLAIAAGNLNTATDGMRSFNRERQAVLDMLIKVNVALSHSSPTKGGEA